MARPHFLRFGVLLTLLSSCGGESSGGGGETAVPLPSPQVESTLPATASTDVPCDQTISARFTMPMNPQTATSGAFTLESLSGPVVGVVSMSPDGMEVRFVPAAPLDYETAYLARLNSTLLSAAGKSLIPAYEWSFTTEPMPWQWTDPVEFETSAPTVPYNYNAMDIALDDDQNMCAIWTQAEGGLYRVYASRCPQGQSWDTPVSLHPAASTTAVSPLVGLGPSGQVLAVWSVDATIWFSTAGLDGAWAAPQQAFVTPQELYRPRLKSLNIDVDGNALLFYEWPWINVSSLTPIPPITDSVNVLSYSPLTGWGVAPVLHPIRWVQDYVIATNAAGYATIVWETLGNPSGIAARRYIPGSGWTSTETLDAPDATRPVDRPNVTLDPDGNCMAVWLKRVAGGLITDVQLFTSRSSPSGGWTAGAVGPATLDLRDSNPQLCLGADGSAVVTWTAYSDDRCRASRQLSSGDWTVPQVIDLGGLELTGSGAYPHFREDGTIVAIGGEIHYNGFVDYGALWVNEFNPSSGWGTPRRLRVSIETISAYFEHDSQGRAFVLWFEQENEVLTPWWIRYR